MSEYSEVLPLNQLQRYSPIWNREEHPLWQSKVCCHDNTKKFKSWQVSADDVLIVPCVVTMASAFCTLNHPNSATLSSSWQLFVLLQDGCVLFCLPVHAWINYKSFGPLGQDWAAHLAQQSTSALPVCGKRWLLIESGEVIWWHCGDTLVCHNV